MIFANEFGHKLLGHNGNHWGDPFLFTKGFTNSSAQYYIECDTLNISHEYTMLVWYQFPVNSQNGADYNYLSMRAGNDEYRLDSYGSIIWKKNNAGIASVYSPAIVANKFNLLVVGGSKELQRALIGPSGNSGLVTNINITALSNASNINKIRLGALTANPTTQVLSYAPINSIFSKYVLVNRFMSLDEIKYSYANKSGNYLLTDNDVALIWDNDIAEILDFSTAQDGSDMRVGFRDLTGNNNHGAIKRLPVGTLSEQLAVANTNATIKIL